MESVEREDQNETPKVILRRLLFADGNVAFAVGTKKGHLDQQYLFDVLLEDILDYVSPDELTRFETQDFLEEDHKEEKERQLKLLRRPRGRPRKSLQPSANQAPPRHVQFETPRTGEKRGRGRPRKFPVMVPSFNGPQPVLTAPTMGTETTPIRLSPETSSDESVTPRRRQYSMVTASGLLPPDISEEETSREVSVTRAQSPSIEPSAKRRKTASNSGHDSNPMSTPMTSPVVRIHQTPYTVATSQNHHTPSKTMIVDLVNENSESEEVDTVKVQPRVSLDDSSKDKEREALLRQFLSRDNRGESTRPTSSSSSDSLMSRAIVAQPSHRKSMTKAFPSHSPARVTTKPVQRINSSPKENRETQIAPTKTPPNNSTYRRQSMTPHFPHARSANYNKSTSSEPAPPPPDLSHRTWQLATMIRPPAEPPQPTNSMSSPHKRKQSQRATATTTQSSRLTIKPLEPTNDIRKFFRPKYQPVPSQECADSTDDDDDDDDEDEAGDHRHHVRTRIAGLLRPKYAPIKQESGSEYEDSDEEEDSDEPITRNALPPPQVSGVRATGRDTSLRERYKQPPIVEAEEDDSSDPSSPDPDPIDLIPRSTIPSPPAPRANATLTNHTTMYIVSEDEDSEQEYLSAEEHELEPRIDVSSTRDIHTGAELDADTEEDSEDDVVEYVL